MNYELVLVTGCCGFIGCKVSELLLKNGISVTGIDNINDYYDPMLKEWRLQQLRATIPASGAANFSFHKCDIANFEEVKTVFANYKIDAVINLAARAGVRASVEDPWIYLDTNLKGTLNLLECCKTGNVKKFVLASTSSIYGDNNKMPFNVMDNTDHPLAPYSATKKGAEAMCYSYHYLHGIDVSIPRYFTVYGPAGRPDMSIFKFIKNIDMDRPIPVFGDGRQKRDFTYIDDIAEGTIRCLKPVGYRIFNLGNDNPVELMYVINLIEKQMGKKAKIQWLPLHPADITATWADIDSSKELLGWSPKTSIEKGIEETIKWYMANKDFVRSLKD
ncbi:MAG: GDP-mannose 4,6-dehydratase [Thermodesulfovibrionales bacterium]|nr:GDP-mannose 4,6-dehydratase [Thermodesulfovibrionales bacterium]